MKRILIPTEKVEDWKRFLAQPELHWKVGFSAMTIAKTWEDAGGMPPEVVRILNTAGPDLSGLDPLAIIPEYKVPLPGGGLRIDFARLAQSSDRAVQVALGAQGIAQTAVVRPLFGVKFDRLAVSQNGTV